MLQIIPIDRLQFAAFELYGHNLMVLSFNWSLAEHLYDKVTWLCERLQNSCGCQTKAFNLNWKFSWQIRIFSYFLWKLKLKLLHTLIVQSLVLHKFGIYDLGSKFILKTMLKMMQCPFGPIFHRRFVQNVTQPPFTSVFILRRRNKTFYKPT